MRMTSGAILPIALAMMALAAPPPPAGAQQRGRSCDPSWDDDCPGGRERIDTTVAFDRRGVIELQGGDIEVTGWSRNEVKVLATTEHGELVFSPGASRITLSARMRRGRLGTTKFQLSVPAGTRVVARTMSGDIIITGVKGEVEASTMNGDIDVADAAERIDITNASGDITLRGSSGTTRLRALSGEIDVRDVAGDLEVETVSGEILMSGITSKFVRAESTSGDVEYAGTVDPAGRYELRSHSGDLRVDIPESASACVDVETFNGEIESDFPITLQPNERSGSARHQRFDFKIGTGQARISLDSFSGEIRIIRRAGTP